MFRPKTSFGCVWLRGGGHVRFVWVAGKEFWSALAQQSLDPRLAPVVHGEIGARNLGEEPCLFLRPQVMRGDENPVPEKLELGGGTPE